MIYLIMIPTYNQLIITNPKNFQSCHPAFRIDKITTITILTTITTIGNVTLIS